MVSPRGSEDDGPAILRVLRVHSILFHVNLIAFEYTGN